MDDVGASADATFESRPTWSPFAVPRKTRQHTQNIKSTNEPKTVSEPDKSSRSSNQSKQTTTKNSDETRNTNLKRKKKNKPIKFTRVRFDPADDFRRSNCRLADKYVVFDRQFEARFRNVLRLSNEKKSEQKIKQLRTDMSCRRNKRTSSVLLLGSTATELRGCLRSIYYLDSTRQEMQWPLLGLLAAAVALLNRSVGGTQNPSLSLSLPPSLRPSHPYRKIQIQGVEG